MKEIKRLTSLVPILFILSSIANAQQLSPPPEAYTACEGKRVGDAAQLVVPRGDTVKGICKYLDGKLVLQPDRAKGKKSSAPPPEAYTACEGKKVGDAAQLVAPRGDTVKGICKYLDGKLVLQPNLAKAN